jgi:hypothetical protein
MKKFILFLVVALCLCHVVFADLKLSIYEKNGEETSYVASEVDSITFTQPTAYTVDSVAYTQPVDSVHLSIP